MMIDVLLKVVFKYVGISNHKRSYTYLTPFLADHTSVLPFCLVATKLSFFCTHRASYVPSANSFNLPQLAFSLYLKLCIPVTYHCPVCHSTFCFLSHCGLLRTLRHTRAGRVARRRAAPRPGATRRRLSPRSLVSCGFYIRLVGPPSFYRAYHITLSTPNLLLVTLASQPPIWDSSQLYLRAWLDDLANWLPAQHSNYAPLVEFGYVLTSRGSVTASSLDHALHCRSRLLVAFENPLPCNPVFTTQGTQQTSRQTRSQTQATSVPAAAGGTAAAPASATTGTVSGLPPLSTDKVKRYIIAPELIEATDRKLKTTIRLLGTFSCKAARRSYASACNGNGRELLHLLATEANAASTATSATISAMLHSNE
eukprot:1217018-Pleurochrysis_carterae.AAC.1